MVYLPLEKAYLHPYSILWIVPLAYGPLLVLTMIAVLTMQNLFIYYPHNCPSTILWLFLIATAYRNITSYLLEGAILKIGTATIRIATCVQCGVHWPLSWIIFQSTTIRQQIKLWSPQVIYNIYYGPPSCGWLSYKTISWLFQFWHRWSIDERIGRKHIPSRVFLNKIFPPYFYCASDFYTSTE